MHNLLYKIFTVIVATSLLNACSAFKSSTQNLSVTAEPRTAEIYVNGNMAGRGTASQAVPRDQNAQVMVRNDGCDSVSRSIGKHMNTTGILDIVGGVLILVPFIGLTTAGAYDLDETNISVTLPGCKPQADKTPHSSILFTTNNV
jgi:hypothetical protein